MARLRAQCLPPVRLVPRPPASPTTPLAAPPLARLALDFMTGIDDPFPDTMVVLPGGDSVRPAGPYAPHLSSCFHLDAQASEAGGCEYGREAGWGVVRVGAAEGCWVGERA